MAQGRTTQGALVEMAVGAAHKVREGNYCTKAPNSRLLDTVEWTFVAAHSRKH